MTFHDLPMAHRAAMLVLAKQGRIDLPPGRGFPVAHTDLHRYGLVNLHFPVGAPWWTSLTPAGMRMMGVEMPAPTVVR